MLAWIRIKLVELGRLTPLALAVAVLPMIGSALLLAFLTPVGNWLRQDTAAGLAAYIIGVAAVCGAALLPTNVIGILGGWAFGFQLGVPALLTGVIGAALLSFHINSRIAGDNLSALIAKYPRAAALYEALLQRDTLKAILIITLIRISVIFPFGVTNLFLAAARVRMGPYLIGTGLGMLPRSAAMVFLGSGLAVLDLNDARDTYLFALGVAGTVLSLILLGLIGRRALDRLSITNEFGRPKA